MLTPCLYLSSARESWDTYLALGDHRSYQPLEDEESGWPLDGKLLVAEGQGASRGGSCCYLYSIPLPGSSAHCFYSLHLRARGKAWSWWRQTGAAPGRGPNTISITTKGGPTYYDQGRASERVDTANRRGTRLARRLKVGRAGSEQKRFLRQGPCTRQGNKKDRGAGGWRTQLAAGCWLLATATRCWLGVNGYWPFRFDNQVLTCCWDLQNLLHTSVINNPINFG